MFKKAVEVKSHQRLSGADRKKLRRTVQNRFPLLTDDLLDAILPPKIHREGKFGKANKQVNGGVGSDIMRCFVQRSYQKGISISVRDSQNDVGSTFIGRMQPNHIVVSGEPMVRKGAIKPVQIMMERRQGDKKVTKVSGMETFLIDPDSFGSELQKKFACSTSVGELPGKKGYEVLIQ